MSTSASRGDLESEDLNAAAPEWLQRQSRLASLRFAPALESEYQSTAVAEDRLRTKWVCALAASLTLVLLLIDAIRIDHAALLAESKRDTEVVIGVRFALLLLFVLSYWLARSMLPTRNVRAWLTAIGALALVVTGWLIATYTQHGVHVERGVMILMVVVLFMPIGLSRLQAAMSAVLGVVLSVGLWKWMFEGSVASDFEHLGQLLGLTIAAGVVCSYWQERTRRRSFLRAWQLQWLAMRDPLTGLFNRRHFDHHSRMCVARLTRGGGTLALLLIDVDHFKQYNDAYGHASGDVVLKRIAATLQSHACRPLDLVARIGGEEMAVLLPDCHHGFAVALAERMIREIATLQLEHAGSPTSRFVTISVGVAVSISALGFSELFLRADRALYEAKRGGRNRVAVSPDQ